MADAQVKVRPAAEDDLHAIAGIYAPYVTDTVATFEEEVPDHAEWRRRISVVTDLGLPFIVAELDGTVVGYAYAGPWKPRAAYRHTVEDSIYLAPGHSGQGIGRTLLTALVEECERIGIRQIIAVIADTGLPGSPALHRSLGFTDRGTLTKVGWKHGRWIDVALLQRELPGSE
ncbi:phosphinothricin acetyltransferase [Murinocardiopsis flavida]|uniref:Phosphinothricin acetyltransferase n=1 Tax=Murinocardiopsis flavida TaxID=645275 RepID=A0A2P8DPW9_9ACTN|nr:GNAT family N-acetyltransferase [Murinocardiopsis flavida]PSK99285.1 phosphinothricin acetyltransferase [Murinocardiopsis flavida]